MKFDQLNIPDQAINYIVNHYLILAQQKEMPVIFGISQTTVENVLQLFLDWAEEYGYIKDGVLSLNQLKSS